MTRKCNPLISKRDNFAKKIIANYLFHIITMRKILSLLFVSLAILSAEAIELPEIIGDNMVVQQEKKARL